VAPLVVAKAVPWEQERKPGEPEPVVEPELGPALVEVTPEPEWERCSPAASPAVEAKEQPVASP
jgi:hypothetical protein